MIGLGAGPGGGALVAGFASRRGSKVAGVLARGHGAVVAARTAGCNRDIGVVLGRCPGCVALVASRAIGGRAHVVGGLARGVGSVMTA